MKTVFTKYSNERAPRYAIKTVILKNNNGELEVRKYPCSEEAENHIENMLSYASDIDRYYTNVGIRAAKARKEGKGVAFEFVKGSSYEEQLERLEKISDVFDFINSFKQRLLNNKNTKEFERTSDFDAIFGNEPLPDKLHATDFCCFDMAFGNLIIKGGDIVVIDYEWCFDFPVPIEYIIYRAVSLYIKLNNKQELITKDIMGYLGIDAAMSAVFDRLEQNFQSYVSRESFSSRTLYTDFDVNNYSFSELTDKMPEMKCYQVYIDCGEGYNERDSYRKHYTGDFLTVDIALTSDVKACRFDPEDNSCIMIIKSILCETNEGEYEPKYITNGIKKYNVIYFSDDPQMIFDEIKPNTSAIHIKAVIINTEPEYIDSLAKVFYDNFEKQRLIDKLENDVKVHISTVSQVHGEYLAQKAENENLREQIAKLNENIKERNIYISSIERSLGWRIIVKLRKIMGR